LIGEAGKKLITTLSQAYRLITQVVIIGSRVFGRAFAEAYKQASASSAYARSQAQSGGAGQTARANVSTGMTLEEACRILNVKPLGGGGGGGGAGRPAPQQAGGGAAAKTVSDAEMEEVFARFKRLFDANDPQKGGSFYLQSKVLRARERIEAEVAPIREKAEHEAEVKGGWKPKVYKDR
jgi:import inner membrane translocase subunit TIM16